MRKSINEKERGVCYLCKYRLERFYWCYNQDNEKVYLKQVICKLGFNIDSFCINCDGFEEKPKNYSTQSATAQELVKKGKKPRKQPKKLMPTIRKETTTSDNLFQERGTTNTPQ